MCPGPDWHYEVRLPEPNVARRQEEKIGCEPEGNLLVAETPKLPRNLLYYEHHASIAPPPGGIKVTPYTRHEHRTIRSIERTSRSGRCITVTTNAAKDVKTYTSLSEMTHHPRVANSGHAQVLIATAATCRLASGRTRRGYKDTRDRDHRKRHLVVLEFHDHLLPAERSGACSLTNP
jgi:hypothetical protein